MRKMILAFSLALVACAPYGDHGSSADALKQANREAWIAEHHKRVDVGQMRRSDYYIELYKEVAKNPVSPSDILAMESINSMISHARKLESGEISKETFDDLARREEIKLSKAIDQEYRSEAEQASMRQANRPPSRMQPILVQQPYMMQAPQAPRQTITNCTSSYGQINCVSY